MVSRDPVMREWKRKLRARLVSVKSGVYVVSTLEFVKIGRAVCPVERLKNLQTGCPIEIELHHFEPMMEDDAIRCETAAHHALADKRHRGEWFRATPEEAITAVNSAYKSLRLPCDLTSLRE